MKYITLAEAKAHLYIDSNDEDSYLEHLIDVAEEQLSFMINRPLAEVLTDGGDLPTPLKHTCLLLIGKLYAHREGEDVRGAREVAFTLAHLFMPYRKEK